ncbi:MAG TPA: MazG nucleotide pyrophosphohydrolase domain-containing protein [Acidimicrobiales bacterium]|nr:MazG nucleotide pyrophosphohydrolase domain-containing protein [Acidimicrobiales bacterium]
MSPLPRPHVTVVGLGPAGEELIGRTAREELASATTVFLRTARHPAAEWVLAARAARPGGARSDRALVTFDHHYDDAATFDDVYGRIVADLVTAAQVVATDGGDVVYAVPGSPFVAERTVELLRADPRVDVTVVPAMSFLDLAWARLGVDPLAEGVRLVDGTRFAAEAAGERGPLLVAQCWSVALLSEVKLVLGETDPALGVTVTVLHHLGLHDEVTAVVPWHELDRSVVPDHLTTLWVPRLAAPVAGELAALDELVRRLRRDCPWDRAQTHVSLERHLLEEAYEVLEAIDALADAERAHVGRELPRDGGETRAGEAEGRAAAHLEEELGDVLFQVFLHARLAAEEGRFTIADVARSLHDKLVSRHPHVFGDVAAHDAAAVVANWEALKKEEKGRTSVTEGIPAALPALALAAKLQRRSTSVPAAAPPDARALGERARALLDAALSLVQTSGPGTEEGPPPDASVAADAGDLLWVAADVVRRLGVDPEDALRAAARRRRDEILAAERQRGAPPPT